MHGIWHTSRVVAGDAATCKGACLCRIRSPKYHPELCSHTTYATAMLCRTHGTHTRMGLAPFDCSVLHVQLAAVAALPDTQARLLDLPCDTWVFCCCCACVSAPPISLACPAVRNKWARVACQHAQYHGIVCTYMRVCAKHGSAFPPPPSTSTQPCA